MAQYYDIAMIGGGNVAWHLSQALENAGHTIHAVYDRRIKKAEALVSKLYNAEATDSLDFSESRAAIFVLAIKDDAIREVAEQLVLPNPDAIVVHTSGSVSIEVLGYALQNYGSFYPFQSFVKTRQVEFKEIPIFIEASNAANKRVLTRLAKSISSKVAYFDSKQRKALHISGVFASNFVNHMLTVAKQIATKHKIDYQWLAPLIVETVNKSLALGPENAQTGPAARGDLEVLEAHLDFLNDDETLHGLYKVLSQHILDQAYYEK